MYIPDELRERLERAAAKKNQTLLELLESVSDDASTTEPTPAGNFLLELAAAAEAANVRFIEPDVASRSRELLERDFANDIDYRTRRD